MTTYRWLEPDEVADWVNPECALQGWNLLNVNEITPTCRVLGAFDGPELVGFFALQLMPVLGPMWADAQHRDGTVSRELAERMHEFMVEVQSRGALMVADSPVTERFAIRHGLERVANPVFVWKPKVPVAT